MWLWRLPARSPLTAGPDFIVITVTIVTAGQKPIQGTRSLGIVNDDSDDDDDESVSSLTSRNAPSGSNGPEMTASAS